MENKETTTEIRECHEKFLINLQLEYLTHKLRFLIYQEEAYARVALDIAMKKRRKIEDLSLRFGMKTIFDDQVDVRKFVEKYFWMETGMPRFQYKDTEQRRVQGNYDRWYILFRGTRVMYDGKEYEVLVNNPAKEEVTIKRLNSKSKKHLKYDEITLNSDYDWI